jgi:hypothetical protein
MMIWFVKVDFNMFSGQHIRQIWTLLNHLGQFERLHRGTDSNPQNIQSNLKIAVA